MRNNIKVFSNPQDLFLAAATDFAHRAMVAVENKGFFTVVLSGGNTAKFFFDSLVEHYKKKIPWDHIQFFFGDERYVPANDTRNNYHMANQYLFSKVAIPKKNIYPMPTTFTDPKDAAQAYQFTLRKVLQTKDNELPKFDLIYLGLGDDAHTASLMPLSDVVIAYSKDPATVEGNELVVALHVPELKMYRITLTPSAINHSTCIVFLVTGANKSSAVREVLEGPLLAEQYPAQLIHCLYGTTFWYLDQTAAEKLTPTLT